MNSFTGDVTETASGYSCQGVAATEENIIDGKQFLEGEFWRELALKELIPHWYEHIRDLEHGGFYTNLSRDWQPVPPWDKYPAMISRYVFSFSAAYLLSGEDKYIEAAREGVDYLLKYGWDRQYGGWFNMLAQSGEPKDASKSIPLQLYTNVGLAMYYFTTGDNRIMPLVAESIRIQQTYGFDSEFGGYYQALNRDLSVLDDGKKKHAHYGYVGSLLLNLWLTTRDPEILKWECQLTDLTLANMKDYDEGWINGYMNSYDRRWKFTPYIMDGAEIIPVGAQLTAALSFLRLYHQSGNTKYLEQGKALGDKLNRYAWDSERGGWIDLLEKTYPHRPVASRYVSHWIQNYGCFLQLQLYRLTGDNQYLERFKKSEIFWYKYFIDKKYGGLYFELSPDGMLIGDGRKAAAWCTSYHETEHSLLNYLYLNVYVRKQPVVMHFKFDCTEPSKKHFVSLIDDPLVQIAGVKINGQPWTEYNAQECSITLPVGKALKTEVRLL
ncbi:MAG: AGE family epimerase/isomerase [Clostridiales bacterium]|nr:AGE family epimerase/isomerase [Clostridiales bacterium]